MSSLDFNTTLMYYFLQRMPLVAERLTKQNEKMAHLIYEHSGVILPHCHLDSILDNQRRTGKDDLELKNL